MFKNTLSQVFFLFFSVICFSQKIDYSSLLIPAELRENANAVIRDKLIEITIEDFNSMVVKEKKVVTVLNRLGNADARISESYDNNTKITKLSAKIYDAFGDEIKKYSKSKFLDISAVDGGTLYSDSRVKYVDYTPVSYPYTLVFESEYKTSTTGFIPWWFPINGYYVSVEKSTFILKNKKRISLRKKEKNFDAFEIKMNDSSAELMYSLSNQKAYKFENSSLPSRDILPKVIVSLNKFNLDGVNGEFTNWKEFGEWMHNSLIAGRDILDEPTKFKILDLVKNVEDPIEKAKIVYQFMQDKTRYISVQVGIGGWQPIAANQVDRVGYGDCKGLTNYTKALLDVVGVKSYYTLVYAKEKRNIDKEFSSLQGNHAILNIPNEGNDIWLECTSQTNPFGFLGSFTDDRNVLVVTPDGGIIKRTVSYKNEQNLQTIKGEIELFKNGDVKATLKRVSKGIQYDDKFSFVNFTKEELIKNYKSSDWSYNNNLEINSVKLINDKEKIVFTEDLELSINNYAAINENEYLFRVNFFNKESYIPKRYRKRKLPLKLNRGYKDVDEYVIKIPATYHLGLLPQNREITTKFGSYSITFKKIDDTTFTYKKSILIKEGTYPKEDYKTYRSFRRSIAKLENIRIAITKK
jgi:bifunctional DNA-binding transcriptional regulator/antitoxin component of YhaV-PrlF toxin-antitoxin module